jgi:hypothetical protein
MARYRLLYPKTEFVFCDTGDWYLLHWKTCSFFLRETCACSVHSSSQKPQICDSFNQDDCWFKQNFIEAPEKTVIRIDLMRFERWLQEVRQMESGGNVLLPPFEESRRIVSGIPVSPAFSPVYPEAEAALDA